MIKVHVTFERITDESAEHGEAEEHGWLAQDAEYTFREIVERMKGGEPSCSPTRGAPWEWITHYGDRDMWDGEWTNESVHFSKSNPARKQKYWRLAMKAAGIKLRAEQ